MTEDLRAIVRNLARQTGMTFREAAAYYQLLRNVGLTSDQAREAVIRIGAAPDEPTRTLLYTVAKAQRRTQLPASARDRIAARIAEAAFEQGLSTAADVFGAQTDGITLAQLHQAHLLARRTAAQAAAERAYADMGRPADYCYSGGPVDWDTGQPLQEGPRDGAR